MKRWMLQSSVGTIGVEYLGWLRQLVAWQEFRMQRGTVLPVPTSIVQGITAILAIEATVGLFGLPRGERRPL